MHSVRPLKPVTLDAVRSARERIRGTAIRTPLIRLHVPGDRREIYLKLENLQPIGSFKLRGAANAIALADPARLSGGVWTASAGNMAQGVAWCARQAGLPCSALVPDRAPRTKVAALERLGARVTMVAFDAWWGASTDHAYEGQDGVFIHPFEDDAVMAGNGTIALELFEDVPDLDAIIVPWGGGGLACGIAAAARELSPSARVVPVEVATATPLTASFAAGRAMTITPQKSFVDGMGGKSVFESVWPLARALVAEPVVVTVAQIAASVLMLAEHAHVVAEGAGAATVAGALAALPDATKIVCVISGGNIDRATLASILEGNVP